MPQQVSNPLSVFDVGLTPRHRLDVLRVGQQYIKLAF